MSEQATITPYRNGPYLVRGEFTILDQDGNEISRRRETVALCRCGRSGSKPFCDGTHKAIRFEAGSEADPPRPLEPPGRG
jgi:CDGSH-type Zn-finger protein